MTIKQVHPMTSMAEYLALFVVKIPALFGQALKTHQVFIQFFALLTHHQLLELL
jgi:hypothetical protein